MSRLHSSFKKGTSENGKFIFFFCSGWHRKVFFWKTHFQLIFEYNTLFVSSQTFRKSNTNRLNQSFASTTMFVVMRLSQQFFFFLVFRFVRIILTEGVAAETYCYFLCIYSKDIISSREIFNFFNWFNYRNIIQCNRMKEDEEKVFN